jgi:hypothetical protein
VSNIINKMKTLLDRLYSDYTMPSRLDVYEDFILAAKNAGYAQTSVRAFYKLLRDGRPIPDKVVLRRHDIDTDLRTTRKLFEIEKRHGVMSSYYFRLSTLDFELMRDIEAYGSEASYHYEELATFAKQNHIMDANAVRARLPEIRANFVNNFQRVEQQFGRKMSTVASHGDFANRRLRLNNTEVLNDQQLRASCGIACETYDQCLLKHFDIYIADRPHPQYYRPIPPLDAIGQHRKIYLLTHPRQCETNWQENTKDNFLRFYEGLAW